MSLLSPLIRLFDIGMIGMADALVETVASSSPANPIASAVFDMTHISSLRYGFSVAQHSSEWPPLCEQCRPQSAVGSRRITNSISSSASSRQDSISVM